MAREELSRRELEVRHEHFPLLIAVRAVKRPAGDAPPGWGAGR